jgi:hypothetical protein
MVDPPYAFYSFLFQSQDANLLTGKWLQAGKKY